MISVLIIVGYALAGVVAAAVFSIIEDEKRHNPDHALAVALGAMWPISILCLLLGGMVMLTKRLIRNTVIKRLPR